MSTAAVWPHILLISSFEVKLSADILLQCLNIWWYFFYTEWQSATLPIAYTCSFCQNINYTEIRKKTDIMFCNACITLFHMFDATQWCNPGSQKWFTKQDTVNLFCTEDSGNVSLNSLWQVKYKWDARQRSTTNAPCTCKKTPVPSTVERQWTDWHERVTSWYTSMGSCIVTVILCVYESKWIVLNYNHQYIF
jgi:hypothetical protein